MNGSCALAAMAASAFCIRNPALDAKFSEA